jgi:uncharacterized protein DUF5675
MKVVLTRTSYTGSATLGTLVVPGIEAALYTVEDPWLDNHPKTSCIPTGDYACVPHGWEKHTPFEKKRVWEITHVPNRTAILFHSGNTTVDTLGCVLVGLSKSGEKVWHSGRAIELMRATIGRKNFDLVIEDAPVG